MSFKPEMTLVNVTLIYCIYDWTLDRMYKSVNVCACVCVCLFQKMENILLIELFIPRVHILLSVWKTNERDWKE